MSTPLHVRSDTVLDLLPAPVFRLDREGKHTYANAAAARALGRDLSQIIGRTPGRAGIPHHLAVAIEEHVRSVLATGTPAEYQVTAPTPAGEVVFLTRLVPEFAADGSVAAVVGVGTDVTTGAASQRALRESEERYRLLVEQVTDYAIFLIDPTGRVASWNFGAERIKGYTADEIIGQHFSRFYTPEDIAAGKIEHELRVGAEVGRFEDEGWRVRKDGSRFWANVVLTALHDETGRLRGFSKVTRDLTDRRMAEEALRASEERYRKVVEDQTEIVCRFTPDGTITFVNEVYGRTFGVPMEELVGHRWQPHVHPDDLPMIEAKLAEMSPANPVVRVENRVYDAAGGVRWMEFVNRGFYGADGAIIELQAVGRDVTDRRAAEEAKHEAEEARRRAEEAARAEAERAKYERQLLQSQKLESLGVLAGGIAHDFNNLLTVVLGNASLARMGLPGNAACHAELEQIEKASHRAAELCQQMLAYAGRGQLRIQPINLNQLVQDIAELLAASISKKAVLRFNLGTPLPEVTGDPTQLRQIVMNLITNASDAIADRSGVITLTSGVLDADAKYLEELKLTTELVPGTYAYVEVSDTGTGMTDEIKAKIFEPFFTTKFTGRGLGLAAVQGIIRTHKGAIKVYSQPGRGTTFKVLLPAGSEAATVGPVPARAAPLKGRGRWVLVVDDEEDIRVTTRKILEFNGFLVELAGDGVEAVEAVSRRTRDFSLVILDLTMPRMGGAETFRQLRRVNADVRVLLTSGFAPEEATSGFEGKGLAGFVRKPFVLADLLSAVYDAVGP